MNLSFRHSLLGPLLGQSPSSLVKENKPRLDLDSEAWLPLLALKGAAGPWASHVTNLSFSASGRIGLGGGCEYCKCEGIPSNLNKFCVRHVTVGLWNLLI